MPKNKKIVSVMIELPEYIALLEYKMIALAQQQKDDADFDYELDELAVQIDKLRLGL
jgi:hypothetical protein